MDKVLIKLETDNAAFDEDSPVYFDNIYYILDKISSKFESNSISKNPSKIMDINGNGIGFIKMGAGVAESENPSSYASILIEIETDNAAFDDSYMETVDYILEQIYHKFESESIGLIPQGLQDINGNTIGFLKLPGKL